MLPSLSCHICLSHVILHPPMTIGTPMSWPEILLVPGHDPPPFLFAWNETTDVFLQFEVRFTMYRRGVLPTIRCSVNLHRKVNCRWLVWLLSEALRHRPSTCLSTQCCPCYVCLFSIHGAEEHPGGRRGTPRLPTGWKKRCFPLP